MLAAMPETANMGTRFKLFALAKDELALSTTILGVIAIAYFKASDFSP